MKILFDFVSESVISSLGWTLLHSVWQGFALGLVAFAGFYLLRKKTAALRYNLGIIVLALQVVTSAATFTYYNSTFKSQKSYQSSAKFTPTLSSPINIQQISYELSATAKTRIWLNMHLQELVVCWFIGAALLMLRFMGGWFYTERLRSRATIVMDKQWRSRFGILAARLNITKSIEFRETTKILTPMVIGALRPVVLIPVGLLTGFSVSQVEAILAHELAHIRRNDYLVNLLQSVTEVFFFFHPALWWISERIRIERENCCDDIAIEVCGDKMSLAHALVKVAEWQSAPTMAMAFASRKPLLLQRIRRVLGVAPKPVRSFAVLPVILIAVGMVIGVSVYAVGQNEKKNTKTAKSKSMNRWKKSDRKLVYNDTLIVRTPGEVEEIEAVEIEEPEEIELNLNVNHNIDSVFSNPTINIQTDVATTLKGMFSSNVFNKAFSEEDEKIRMQIEALQLQLEKFNFDAERAERELEKVEWRKESAVEARQELVEKRRNILNSSKNSGFKNTEIEKQLADFEDQVKIQEEEITKLNAEITKSRIDAHTAAEPARNIEKQIEELESKMSESFALASFKSKHAVPKATSYYRYSHPAPPAAPKPPKSRQKYYSEKPSAPVAPKKPAKAPAAPIAPPPPIKK